MGVSPKQREPANLIDGDTATKWLDENLRDASWLGRTTDPPASAIHSILRFELAQPTQVRATPHPHPHPQPQPHPHPIKTVGGDEGRARSALAVMMVVEWCVQQCYP